MTTRQISIDEDDFQAFVDGQLPPDRRRAVMAYLAGSRGSGAHERLPLADRGCTCSTTRCCTNLCRRAWIERYRGRTAGGQAAALGRAERAGLAPRAAGIALLLAGASGGWMLGLHYVEPESSRRRSALPAWPPTLTSCASDMHPVEFGADQQERLLLWLSERLGQAVQAPDLQDLGFELVGGRLPAAGQAAAQLMYENPDAQRITLYIRGTGPARRGRPRTARSRSRARAASLVYWRDGPFAYALLGRWIASSCSPRPRSSSSSAPRRSLPPSRRSRSSRPSRPRPRRRARPERPAPRAAGAARPARCGVAQLTTCPASRHRNDGFATVRCAPATVPESSTDRPHA